MLTGDLLVARTYKGKIEPVYAAITPENMELAEAIIDIFMRNVGKTYGSLIEETKSFEEMNFRLIRGWIQLLERRCVIEQDSIVEPSVARKAVFDECRGMALADERQRAIDSAAKKLSITSEQLENTLWADYEENLIVKEFEPITAENLLRQYNLSLVQTLLFKATGLEFKIEGNFQNVFRKIKRLGLIYNIENDTVFLDGALSLFKMTERYGTSLAKLLPEIMRADKWSINASVMKRSYGDKRIFEFALDDTKKIFNTNDYSDNIFDSAIEEEFARHDFGGWNVKREPAVLKAGQYAFIPDFLIENSATKIYVEIVGFWTPEYLQKKIQKVNQVKETLMLLVDKNLACSITEFKINSGNVIFFDKKIPYSEIAKVLNAYEEKQLASEINSLKDIEISLEGDVISIAKIAETYKISAKALYEILKTKKKHEGYLLFQTQLVSQKTIDAIRDDLEFIKNYPDTLKVFEKYGVKGHSEVLGALGYKIKWAGLKPENAEIVVVKNHLQKQS
ncbi:MAG: DUF790 family protein [Nanoarchaeota archaeon]|nr:DUF790 family protein [Nanoarchaeota archaeon]MBU4300441.1 DUF790 family protein [Nanoarchaeota archaeon]MBU4452114.1 DUF790 family protein [Nanoarchaeota archaeon]MCG2724618.1 DUF790 family protein [archaeon]